MKLVRPDTSCPANAQGAVVALGNFDGIHIGHQTILATVKSLASNYSCPSALLTFEPHPRSYFKPDSAPYRITPFREKMHRLQELELDFTFVMSFNAALATLSAQDFLNHLKDTLCVKHIVIGHDFIFGNGREGNGEILAAFCDEHGIGFTRVDAISDASGAPYSSSRVRTLLESGDVSGAAELLQKPYTISGHVKHGEKRGREIGFPTANLTLHDHIRPAYGVYAVTVRLPGDSTAHPAVANFGIRPTFENKPELLEVHLFNWNDSLYGKRICVEFNTYIRAEQSFDSLDALKQQIVEDCKAAKTIYGLDHD